jgi:hypothetical protein
MMMYGAASWLCAVLAFAGKSMIPVHEELHQEFACRIGFVSYERLELFEYVLAPWLAEVSAPFVMIIGLAVALRG